MKNEEYLELVEEHIAKIPQADAAEDPLVVREWAAKAGSMLAQLSEVLRDELRVSGGSFAEDLRRIAAESILRDPLHTQQTKEATLAPGVEVVSIGASAIAGAGAYIDIRIRTGVVK